MENDRIISCDRSFGMRSWNYPLLYMNARLVDLWEISCTSQRYGYEILTFLPHNFHSSLCTKLNVLIVFLSSVDIFFEIEKWIFPWRNIYQLIWHPALGQIFNGNGCGYSKKDQRISAAICVRGFQEVSKSTAYDSIDNIRANNYALSWLNNF